MIPVRVRVQGFMSYRDAAVLEFDGAPLWMLSGPNGSGKSTIFDAITFALYGLHRGGKQDARELINHDSDRLSVEFDFLCGAQMFRAKRTLARTNRSSFQGFLLPTGGDKTDPKTVAETDTKIGFESWIRTVIGLDDKTFTSSVLLQQGRSDALLESTPAQRHAILSQIVELGEYEKLHAKTDTRRKEFEAAARVYDSQLQGIEPVDDDEITRLDIEATRARSKVLWCQQQARELAALKVSAARWMELVREREEITRALQSAQSTLERAESIGSAAARRRELDSVVPHLEKLDRGRRSVAEHRRRAAEAEVEAAQWREFLAQTKQQIGEVRDELALLSDEREAEQKKREEARETQAELALSVAEVDECEQRQRELAALENELSTFAPDLDVQISELTEQVEELSALKTVLPWLSNYARARDKWCARVQDLAPLKATETALQSTLQAAHDDLAQVEANLQSARVDQQNAQDKHTHARTLLQTSQAHRARFEEIDGAPACSLCGQTLDEAHLADERARLDTEIARHQSTLAAAQTDVTSAAAKLASCEQAARDQTQRTRQIEKDQADNESIKREVISLGQEARNEAQNAFDNLPDEWRFRIHPSSEKITECLRGEFPTQLDLDELKTRVGEHGASVRQLESARTAQAARDRKRIERDACQARCQELTTKYSPQRAAEILQRHRVAGETVRTSTSRLQQLSIEIGEWEKRWRELETERERAQSTLSEASTRAGALTARGEQISQQLAEYEGQTPDDWKADAQDLSPEKLEQWREERASLALALDDLSALETARTQHAPRLARLQHIEIEREAVPAAARRDASEIDVEARDIGAQQEQWEALAQESESEKQALQSRKMQRAEIDGAYHLNAQAARTHRELAELLGRDRLQRYLLQQAETAIVSNANVLLDRISGGTLRLELKKSDEESGAKNGKARETKALELVARNTQTSEQAMPVYLLSGSQRFRVAVALALGIGQFAGNSNGQNGGTDGTRRIESVIIDEGFGSLDGEGRREIIEELNNLKNVLARVILVSHQEEFADAFPNRYHIQLEGGTSTARIVEGE